MNVNNMQYLAYGSGIQTHALSIVSLHPEPLDQGPILWKKYPT